jgi:hypothetical protein
MVSSKKHKHNKQFMPSKRFTEWLSKLECDRAWTHLQIELFCQALSFPGGLQKERERQELYVIAEKIFAKRMHRVMPSVARDVVDEINRIVRPTLLDKEQLALDTNDITVYFYGVYLPDNDTYRPMYLLHVDQTHHFIYLDSYAPHLLFSSLRQNILSNMNFSIMKWPIYRS